MNNHREKASLLLDEVEAYLRYLADMGCRGLDCGPAGLEKLQRWGIPPTLPAMESLDDIRREIGNCRRCRLCSGRSRIVFGAGDPRARLVFVGEAPGFEEDQCGEPFVGAAGELLTKIIKAIQLTRETVYICNVVKCRPPENRTPSPEEIRACMPFLKRQLAAIRPEFICTLGSVATHALLDTARPISMIRGQFTPYGGALVMPTYHPAYLLRNPDKKRDVWEDMKNLAGTMGIRL
ncbi:MAG: uracil-DNA glycosylase [Thermodesulfobacteriota bacterium]